MAGKKKHKKAPAPTSPQIDLRVFLRKLRQQLDGPRGQRSGRASRARRSIWKARRVSDFSSASFLPARCAGNNGQLRLHPVPVLFFLFFFFFSLLTLWDVLAAIGNELPLSNLLRSHTVLCPSTPGPRAPGPSIIILLEPRDPAGLATAKSIHERELTGWLACFGWPVGSPFARLPARASKAESSMVQFAWSASDGALWYWLSQAAQPRGEPSLEPAEVSRAGRVTAAPLCTNASMYDAAPLHPSPSCISTLTADVFPLPACQSPSCQPPI